MANTTNFGWETPDDTDLVKDGAAAMRTLGNAIDTSLVDLKGGTTGQVLSKASNTDMDFTWSSVDPLTILDAKGDLISATAADTPARLAVGTNGQYLSANSSTSTGLEWITPPSSGGLTLISEQTASAASSLSFSSIPGTYKSLILTWSGLFTSDDSRFNLRFNNVSTSSYGYSGLYITASSGLGVVQLNTQVFQNNILWNTTGTNVASRGKGFLQIDNYSSTSKLKTFWGNSGFLRTATGDYVENFSGTFDSTSAITSLDFYRSVGTGTFSNGTNTSIRLYGLS